MSAEPIPVLIAGGGPVGLALAVELGRAGIACTLIERRDGSIGVPKMSGLSIRSMEFNRRWGIADTVKRSGWPPTHPQDMVYCTSMIGYELARHKVPAYVDQCLSYTPEPRVACAQIFYDPILLATARALPSIAIRHMTSLNSFIQCDDHVEATVTDRKTGKSETIAARYLIGCDGADGTVVTSLGFGYEGLGIVANSVNVYFRSAELMKIHDKGWARFFRFTDEGGTWGEIIGIDGKELWRLSVLKADPAFDGHAYMRRLAGTEIAYEIISVMAWERRERVAEHYRDRRVFIAGDAAHQNSPTGGLGLHTGLADAVDLGWKLVATLQGWGGAHLLNAYEAERKPVAFNNVHASTDEFVLLADLPGGPAIAQDTAEGAALRQRWAEAYRAWSWCDQPDLHRESAPGLLLRSLADLCARRHAGHSLGDDRLRAERAARHARAACLDRRQSLDPRSFRRRLRLAAPRRRTARRQRLDRSRGDARRAFARHRHRRCGDCRALRAPARAGAPRRPRRLAR